MVPGLAPESIWSYCVQLSLRFSWVLVASEGPVIAAGTDVAVLSSDSRLQAVTGFFDQAPVLP